MLPFVLFSLGSIMIALAYFVWHARRTSPINFAFSGFTMSLAAWMISIAFVQTSGHVEPWVRLSFAGASFIPCTFLAFVRVYPNVTAWPTLRSVVIAVTAACLFAFFALFTDLIVHDAIKMSGVLTRQTGALYQAFAAYFIITWLIAHVVLIVKWNNATGLRRLQLRYLGSGITIFGIAGMTANLIYPMLTGRSTYVWLGPCFAFAFVAFVGHAIIRHSLMELRVVVHRGLTIGLAMIISLVPVGVFLAAFWPKLFSHLDSQELVVVLSAMTIVSAIVSVTREYAGALLDRYVYRTHANYQQT